MCRPVPLVSRSLFRRFRKGEEGTATVEFVIWLPLLFAVLGLIADASMVFGSKSTILRVVQDANRAMSTGKITKLEDAEDFIRDGIANVTTAALIDTRVADGVITSTVTVPLAQLASLGLISSFYGVDLTVAAQHLSEG